MNGPRRSAEAERSSPLTRTGANFKTLRGVDLQNLRFTFTHANTDFEGCDSIAGGDCSLLGVPTLENETIGLDLALDVRLTVTSFLLTYGLTDRVDVGVVLPVVSTSVQGSSTAQINPFGPPPAVHFFGGTPDNPILTASRFVRRIGHRPRRRRGPGEDRLAPGQARFPSGVLADVRFPTGSNMDLLGSGSFAARGLAIVSARFGDFSPHANVGYLYRGGDFESDAVLGHRRLRPPSRALGHARRRPDLGAAGGHQPA